MVIMSTFKIWNANSSTRKTVFAKSIEELCEKGAKKLGLQGKLRVFLKKDGTEVEDDEVLFDHRGPCAGKNVILILLQDGESWSKNVAQEKSLSNSLSDTSYLLMVISQRATELHHMISPSFGLLEDLHSTGFLDDKSYEDVKTKPDPFKKVKRLLHYVNLKTNEKHLLLFLDALRRTSQSHIVNYLLNNGERLEMRFGLERPLSAEEMSHVQANECFLLKNLCITEEFLARLQSSDCITREHMEHVKAQSTKTEQIVELLRILRRCSAAALKKFIDGLRDTNQLHVADVLSSTGVAVPVHVDLTIRQSNRSIEEIEEDLASKLNCLLPFLSQNFRYDPKRQELFDEINALWVELEIHGIVYKCSTRGNSVAVYLWCRDGQSMSHLRMVRHSGCLGRMIERTLEHLSEENNEELTFSLKIIEHEWKLAKCYFKISGTCSSGEIIHPLLFEKLPKELLELILMKSLLSFYNATWGSFPFTAFDPYIAMKCVCQDWANLIDERPWFRNTVRTYLARHKIIQRNSVLDVLPKELQEIILMRSFLSFLHVPSKMSFVQMRHATLLKMRSVCQQWSRLIASRTWFSKTLKSYLKKNSHIAVLQEHRSIFDRCLDVDCYFLCEMRNNELISEEQLFEISSEEDRQKQIGWLFAEIFLKFSAKSYAQFLKILHTTSQSHIANYLMRHGDPVEHDDRPLDDEERARLDRAVQHLRDFVPADEFLDGLETSGCITKIHAETISMLPEHLKTTELLRILQRRSCVTLRLFSAQLWKLNQYNHVAQLLTSGELSEENSSNASQDFPLELNKSAEEFDIKALGLTLVQILTEITEKLRSGENVTIHDIHRIRMLWIILESRQETLSKSEEKNEPASSMYDLLITDDYNESMETEQCQWIEDENVQLISRCQSSSQSNKPDIPQLIVVLMKIHCDFIRQQKQHEKLSKMKEGETDSGKEMEMEVNGKANSGEAAEIEGGKTDSGQEMETKNSKPQIDSKYLEKLERIIYELNIQIATRDSIDNQIIYLRSASVQNISWMANN